jgi:regulator of sirC expression with transglutaminase-like and TPR domain
MFARDWQSRPRHPRSDEGDAARPSAPVFRLVVLSAMFLLIPPLVEAHPPVAAPAAATTPSLPPSHPPDIQQWIAALDSPRYADRERATRRLLDLGREAESALTDALRSGSAEVRRRAAFVLRDGQWRRLRAEFAEFASRPDHRLDTEEGMWLVSRIVDPDAEFLDLRRQLDGLAQRVRARLPDNPPPRRIDPKLAMRALRETLFEDARFAGAVNDYVDPRNSSLASVLKRKRGLPILMAHLTIAVGRRLGWPLRGIATPGRYLLKYDGAQAPNGFPNDDIVMDAFDGGKILSADDLQAMFPGLGLEEMLAGDSDRSALRRMLNNLVYHLEQTGAGETAGLAAECQAMLGDDPE